jgi:hypothetical protein
VSALVASAIYIGWMTTTLTLSTGVTHAGFNLGFSLWLWLTGGFVGTLVVMVMPWLIAVWAYRRLRWSNRIYFPPVGGFFVFVIGCAMASVSPKPLWIEDQTFFEGAMIAAGRQGLSFLVSGLVFGVSYWLLSERHDPDRVVLANLKGDGVVRSRSRDLT